MIKLNMKKKGKIIFILGPVSSGKSTIAKIIKNSANVNTDYIYQRNLNGMDFETAYKSKSFQKRCWKEYYSTIKNNAFENKLVVAQTTGTNPRLKPLIKNLKKEFEVRIIKINVGKKDIVKRTKIRRGIEKREVEKVLLLYNKLSKKSLKPDFIINNTGDLIFLKQQVRLILKNIVKAK